LIVSELFSVEILEEVCVVKFLEFVKTIVKQKAHIACGSTLILTDIFAKKYIFYVTFIGKLYCPCKFAH
jgi:hypothetical protein